MHIHRSTAQCLIAFSAIFSLFGLTAISTQASSSAPALTPSGSYSMSCKSCSSTGNVLACDCVNESGQYLNTSLNLAACNSVTTIANINGVLACPGATGTCTATSAEESFIQGALSQFESLKPIQEWGWFQIDLPKCISQMSQSINNAQASAWSCNSVAQAASVAEACGVTLANDLETQLILGKLYLYTNHGNDYIGGFSPALMVPPLLVNPVTYANNVPGVPALISNAPTEMLTPLPSLDDGGIMGSMPLVGAEGGDFQ